MVCRKTRYLCRFPEGKSCLCIFRNRSHQNAAGMLHVVQHLAITQKKEGFPTMSPQHSDVNRCHTSDLGASPNSWILYYTLGHERKSHLPDCTSTPSNLLAPSFKQHTTKGQSGEEAYSECILISPVISNIHRQYVIGISKTCRTKVPHSEGLSNGFTSS